MTLKLATLICFLFSLILFLNPLIFDSMLEKYPSDNIKELVLFREYWHKIRLAKDGNTQEVKARYVFLKEDERRYNHNLSYFVKTRSDLGQDPTLPREKI